MSHDMLETARALAARDCQLPVMFVVDRGVRAYHCGHCGVHLESDEDCGSCDEEDWSVEQTWPDAVRLPDLASDANGAALLGMLREAKVPHLLSWVPKHKSHDNHGYYVTVPGHEPQRSKHLAHAVALAWLLLEAPHG
jgi:hypothetical protein